MEKRWKRLYGLNATFICPYCLKEFPLSKATKDHKNPYARFKDNSPDNIVMCCKEDNNRKGMLTVEEFMLFLLLDRVRKGQKDERDLEILDRNRRELCNIINRAGEKFR